MNEITVTFLSPAGLPPDEFSSLLLRICSIVLQVLLAFIWAATMVFFQEF